jgi:4'-phosphopantetheinyl transferase
MIKSLIKWRSPPQTLQISHSVVHLWRVDLTQPIAPIDTLLEILSVEEQDRARRFHFEVDRQRFIVGRGTLRILLGRYLQVEPQQLQFKYGDRGKPLLAEPFCRSQIQFNVSHSQNLALYAIACGREVGVDVEQIRPIRDLDRLAARFFSAREYAHLQTLELEARLEPFFGYWTCKEAYVKACGVGLSLPTREIEVMLEPGQECFLQISGCEENAKNWSLKTLKVIDNFIGAIVLEKNDFYIDYFSVL